MDSHERTTTRNFPDAAWQAATFCGPNGGNCVEVNLGTQGAVGLRDSKAGAGPALAVDEAGWTRFLEATRTNRLGHD